MAWEQVDGIYDPIPNMRIQTERHETKRNEANISESKRIEAN
jgi:hypothetical protein